ncbi:hypothetical protein CCB80_00215 [Armatimonadetes bacterium Uphvl-Ar1]|nr:hypothetical protein CCB80_00215 [Armatimonadetes bacterium Uphvl-Ar1]
MPSLAPKLAALALASIVTITAVPSFFSPQTSLFTEQEIASIKKFWNQSGRHVVTFLPGSEINGPYAPRQTPDGSTWLLNYFRARGNAGKVVPGKTPEALNDRQKQWDAWIEGRYSWDEYTATLEAYSKNKEETSGSAPAPTLKPAADPGPIPPISSNSPETHLASLPPSPRANTAPISATTSTPPTTTSPSAENTPTTDSAKASWILVPPFDPGSTNSVPCSPKPDSMTQLSESSPPFPHSKVDLRASTPTTPAS